MSGATQDAYAEMMKSGGRSVEGNRSKSGKDKLAKSKPKSKSKSSAKRK
jgi:hypothetical protein